MNEKLKEKTREALTSVLPITGIVLLLSVTLVPMEIGTLALFLTGAVLLIIGMGFFQLGAEMAMTPLGQGVGKRLMKKKNLLIIVAVCFLMGAIITISEPDLQVLADQVASIPNQVLIYTVAVGVGIFTAIAALRILFRISLSKLLICLYVLLFILSAFTPSDFIAVAFDSGGVTTGPMTVPFIMALGVGLSAARSDKDGTSDSFGLVALCSVGPIMMVMLLGIFYHPSDAVYTPVEVTEVITTQDVAKEFVLYLPHYAREVLQSMLPIIGVFILFQILTRNYHKRQILRMAVGFAYTIFGLILFLTGVNVGFTPVGNLLGSNLTQGNMKWLLLPMGMVVGYYIVKAEPAVQVLNDQVEELTGGMISHRMMNIALSGGVACAVTLAMVRVLTGISIYWIIIPGYLLALILSRIVPNVFVGIAFDSGGVASGPMTSTFLLPLAMGACTALGGNVVTDAFGIVALVALAPLIAIQIMGLIYARRERAASIPREMMEETDDDIVVEIEEE
ncbi:MAG TPA: DUF1538 domain-containing protein [Candidatus Onthocola gallistercoris]|uniref:DUF1538 domain-containing protein n=1 Tax=Candidatus Onthocola gallistercoris TaxID=2840876 RepID=A0A9D1KXH0_9FIRM|nr:DUF1538 domain-containing protein [Candidatus Onthocola gallistercoris]